MKLTHEGPVVIEMNPRLAGGFIPELVRLAKGVDLIRESISVVTGGFPNLQHRSGIHASIRFLLTPRAGTITKIEGLDQAEDISGVAEVKTYVRTGAHVRLHGDFRDRIGHVISCGTTEVLAAHSAQMASSKITIHVSS
jgi:argininosuccinate lyase